MTLPDRCPLCGGRVVPVWDKGKCMGYCGLKVDHIESLSDVERARHLRRIDRQIAIEQAQEVEVRGDRL